MKLNKKLNRQMKQSKYPLRKNWHLKKPLKLEKPKKMMSPKKGAGGKIKEEESGKEEEEEEDMKKEKNETAVKEEKKVEPLVNKDATAAAPSATVDEAASTVKSKNEGGEERNRKIWREQVLTLTRHIDLLLII